VDETPTNNDAFFCAAQILTHIDSGSSWRLIRLYDLQILLYLSTPVSSPVCALVARSEDKRVPLKEAVRSSNPRFTLSSRVSAGDIDDIGVCVY
jgi:hypothetical protein